MPCAPNFSFTRGSTFSANCVYTPDAGGPPDLDGVTIQSRVRDARGYQHTLTTTVTSSTTFVLSYDNTEDWYAGTAFWDILFINNGVAFYSQTVNINVVNNVTPNE
jgi:hypothetical protein